jgi:hypothetical protein
MRGRTNAEVASITEGVQSYFDTGFTQEFLVTLQKMGAYIYSRYCNYAVDEEEFVDAFCERSYTLISLGVYDSSKANLATFLHSLGRNLASGIKAKQSKIDDTDSALVEVAASTVNEEDLSGFLNLLSSKYLQVDRGALAHDIAYRCETPVTTVYSWRRGSGPD